MDVSGQPNGSIRQSTLRNGNRQVAPKLG